MGGRGQLRLEERHAPPLSIDLAGQIHVLVTHLHKSVLQLSKVPLQLLILRHGPEDGWVCVVMGVARTCTLIPAERLFVLSHGGEEILVIHTLLLQARELKLHFHDVAFQFRVGSNHNQSLKGQSAIVSPSLT